MGTVIQFLSFIRRLPTVLLLIPVVFSTVPISEATELSEEINSGWLHECIDCPRQYNKLGDRSLQLDHNGIPHVAYGAEDLYHAWLEDDEWQVEVVDSDSPVGLYTSLAFDSSGNPHISYYDLGNTALKHAWYDGARWRTEVVSDDLGWYIFVDAYTAISIDDSNNVSIAFGAWHLRYAHYDGVQWTVTTVDDTENVGFYLGLALADDAVPHIAYYDRGNGTLKHAWNDGVQWFTEVIDSDGKVGQYPSIQLDSSGLPRVSYYDETNTSLKYSWFDGVRWKTEIVDGMDDSVGKWGSLIVDRDDMVHISYGDHDRDLLKYASMLDDEWNILKVNDVQDGGQQTSLQVDQTGQLHIVYVNQYLDLKYTVGAGSEWSGEKIDTSDSAGWDHALVQDVNGIFHAAYYRTGFGSGWLGYARYSDGQWIRYLIERQNGPGSVDIAVDEAGNPHVAYIHHDYDIIDSEIVKYATYDGTHWQFEIVNDEGNAGGVSLELDNHNRPHLSYHDRTTDQLLYAHRNGEQWSSEYADYGEWASLALDSMNRPHISYIDPEQEMLKYASHDGSQWQIEVVEADEYLGHRQSLAIDGEDNPHISYYDMGRETFNYARRFGDAWMTEVVDEYVEMLGDTSLALDGEGRPQASYFVRSYYPNSSTKTEIRVATYSECGWLSEIVLTDLNPQLGYNSMVITPEDEVYLSYFDLDNHDLKIANQNTTVSCQYVPMVWR